MCFNSMIRNYLNCKIGCPTQDSVDHCRNCVIINEHVGRSMESLSDIFELVIQQEEAI